VNLNLDLEIYCKARLESGLLRSFGSTEYSPHATLPPQALYLRFDLGERFFVRSRAGISVSLKMLQIESVSVGRRKDDCQNEEAPGRAKNESK